MPKKSTRHVKESGLTRSSHHRNNNSAIGREQETKYFRSVRIGLTNGKRWLSLKKRLGLSTDEDVAVYLLDLAESASRHSSKYNEEEQRTMDQDQKNKTQMASTENMIEDTGDSLRRSLRKQSSNTALVPEACPMNATRTTLSNDIDLCAKRDSRSKHHKNRAKHHKDKRKKKRHLKTVDVVLSIESTKQLSNDAISEDKEQIAVKKDNSKLIEGIDIEPNLKDSLCIATKEVKSDAIKTDHVDRIEFIEHVNSNKNILYRDIEDVHVKNMMINNQCEQSSSNSLTIIPSMKGNASKINAEQVIDTLGTMPSAASCVQPIETRNDKSVPCDICYIGKSKHVSAIANCSSLNTNVAAEMTSRKLKKKRKRLKYDTQEEEDEDAKEDSSDDFLDDSVHKHRKKRHKHTSDHKSRRHHDVRKAPQDGIIVQSDINACSLMNDVLANTTSKSQSEPNIENLMSEPQRLAIKIKLCQECNNRHLQDACPLTTPQFAISDFISYEDWLNKYKENAEVLKAIKCDDPMSEGYKKIADDSIESDDESLLNEHCKIKVKAQKEEKRLTVDTDRPLYARDSLPECLELKITNSEHGLGIYAKNSVPMHVKLGPLVGQLVREMDIPDDFTMRHIWEINNNGKTLYISTTNPLKSNWIRYIRPAETKEERSVAVITKQGELHLVTTQNIVSGMELTYWADSQSSAWTRKNKVDKTSMVSSFSISASMVNVAKTTIKRSNMT